MLFKDKTQLSNLSGPSLIKGVQNRQAESDAMIAPLTVVVQYELDDLIKLLNHYLTLT